MDLVLLDLSLPDADGLEVLGGLRNDFPAVPVVVLSASDRREDVLRAIDLGVNYLDIYLRRGWIPPMMAEGGTPGMEAAGVVLDDGKGRFVLCALDWCGLCNSSHMLFRKKIAAAAGTDVSRVAVQTVHQHTAPMADADAVRLLESTANPPPRKPGWGQGERISTRVSFPTGVNMSCCVPVRSRITSTVMVAPTERSPATEGSAVQAGSASPRFSASSAAR